MSKTLADNLVKHAGSSFPGPGKDAKERQEKNNLRYDLAESFEIFDETTFHRTFAADLRNARESVVIHSPFVSRRGIDRYLQTLAELSSRAVRTCTYVQEPEDWISRHQDLLPVELAERLKQMEILLSDLQSAGVHVNLKRRAHEKLAVIDDSILWEGSLNILSHRNTSERMTRWESTTQVANAIVKHKLDACNACWKNGGRRLLTDEQLQTRLVAIGRELSAKRESLRLSQRGLADLIHTDQSLISRFERGTCALNSATVIQIASSLGFEVVLVPSLLRSAVAELVVRQERHHRAER